jgi:CheY-like chemotaxis protein
MHHGFIGATSEGENKGCTFFFELACSTSHTSNLSESFTTTIGSNLIGSSNVFSISNSSRSGNNFQMKFSSKEDSISYNGGNEVSLLNNNNEIRNKPVPNNALLFSNGNISIDDVDDDNNNNNINNNQNDFHNSNTNNNSSNNSSNDKVAIIHNSTNTLLDTNKTRHSYAFEQSVKTENDDYYVSSASFNNVVDLIDLESNNNNNNIEKTSHELIQNDKSNKKKEKMTKCIENAIGKRAANVNRAMLINKQQNEELRKVLLVDDGPIIRKIMEKSLCSFGFTCIHAMNGIEAIQIIKDSIDKNETPFYGIIIDYYMPLMNGPEAIKNIRNEQLYKGLIVAVTGSSTNEDIENLRECGADRVLLKPVD